MTVTLTQEPFGKDKNGQEVFRYTFKNSNNVTVRIINYGGIITDILVPDKHGEIADINLGFDNMEGYNTNPPYFGALIGRVANRIAGGKFTMDGQEHQLIVNRPPNCLHGGVIGFDKVLWQSQIEGTKLVLAYISKDGEENFPGKLTVVVTYELTEDNSLEIDYTATTTKATPINLTNHAYFNLAGHCNGSIEDHVVTIRADSYLPTDENNIPTGEVKSVEGTLFDVRTPVQLGDRMKNVSGGKGFDNNFLLAWSPDKMERNLAARVEHPPSGRYLECYTTEPGLQFYTSCNLKSIQGKGGCVYNQFGALCLEAQHFPDSVHHDNFPDTILRPGQTYRQITAYKFGTIL